MGCGTGNGGGGDLVDGIVHQHFKVKAFTIVKGIVRGGNIEAEVTIIRRDKGVSDTTELRGGGVA